MTPQALYDLYLAQPGCDIVAHLPFLRESAHGDMLEIGVRGGASTSALLSGLDDKEGGHLWSVDFQPCMHFPQHPRWTFLQMHSLTDAPNILAAVPEPLDVLFIDGDHSYDAARSDLRVYGPLMRSGGLILMHDVDLLGAGVRNALEDYAGGLKLTPEYHPGSYGLGILRV
jgi:predicted O-methyltransferase YrrM